MTPTPPPTFSIDTFTSFPGILVPILALMLVVLIAAWVLLFALGARRQRRPERQAIAPPSPDLAPPPTRERVFPTPPAELDAPPPTTPAPDRHPSIEAELQPAAPPPATDFGLQLLLPDGTELSVPRLPAIIGRAPVCDIRLDNESVSGQHARLDYDRQLESITITDLDSANGTQVNGRPTRKNILRHDDRISLGSVTLTFLDTGFLPPIA